MSLSAERPRSFEPSSFETLLRTFNELQPDIQQLARENFELLKANPQRPSLHLKRVGRYWSVRVGLSFRAVGLDSEKGIVWFWIGDHEEYDRLFA